MVESLAYVNPIYFVRYRMPDKLFLIPVHFSYILPVLLLYVVMLIMLIQIRRGGMS
jgi:hypothetical protein